jgi:hypothetical protein
MGRQTAGAARFQAKLSVPRPDPVSPRFLTNRGFRSPRWHCGDAIKFQLYMDAVRESVVDLPQIREKALYIIA